MDHLIGKAIDDLGVKFDHFGIFTHNREKVKDFLMLIPGSKITADRVVDFPREIVTIGSPQKISLYHIDIAGHDVEVIEPVDCPESYVEKILKKHGDCFHHLALTFDSIEHHREMCRILESNGYRCRLECTPRNLLVNYYECDSDGAIAYELKSELE